MASNHGKRFESDFLTSVRSWGWWAERFTDRMWSQGGGSVQSPPDMIAVTCNKLPVLMELKAAGHVSDIEKATIALSRCQGHQLERLLSFPGEAYVVVMFYEGARALKRCGVMIPAQSWAGASERYNRLSVRLDALREDIPTHQHLRWVGRNADTGPWVRCTSLGETIKGDV